MISMNAEFVVDRGLEARPGQTKYYKIGIYWFSANHAALRSKNKGWLVPYQNNVSEWRVNFYPLFQWASTIKIH